MPAERQLWEYHNSGFTEQDLESVLTFVLWRNGKSEPKFRTRIQFHRIVGDLEWFNSVLGESQAWARNRRQAPTPKQHAVAALRGSYEPEGVAGQARTLKDVLKGIQ